MTVICWDGRTLAADKQATHGNLRQTVTKVYRVGALLVGFTGELSQGMEMLAWVQRGRIAAEFPPAQRKQEEYCETVVIECGRVLLYLMTPYPAHIEDPCFATGSGRDFALAALFCGQDARKAVTVACQFDNSCGMGVDAIDFTPDSA